MKAIKLLGTITAMLLLLCGVILTLVFDCAEDICLSLCIIIYGLALWIVFDHIESVIKHTYATAFVVIVFLRDIVSSICYGYGRIRRIRQRAGSYSKIYSSRCKHIDDKFYKYFSKYERR